jgi:hypothetical protein
VAKSTWRIADNECFTPIHGAFNFFPSDQPFFLRLKVERVVFANVLFLALDPVFVSCVAEGLELDADRIELIEKRGGTELRRLA